MKHLNFCDYALLHMNIGYVKTALIAVDYLTKEEEIDKFFDQLKNDKESFKSFRYVIMRSIERCEELDSLLEEMKKEEEA